MNNRGNKRDIAEEGVSRTRVGKREIKTLV